ncbi:unnamed protein product [Chondrus crispus]|uniref:Uncharacterized protein n=1 Tax=Chondrus crispus TaxID=2769 RepID=R7QM23_CHOCR|nr:unnamed protein product [Chondrus crispus]CDF38511.1 unnamed protein product [Chondrus crispus]|eukprot:XP_005718404.1 unnamed protein product [Chondrus crispus]
MDPDSERNNPYHHIFLSVNLGYLAKTSKLELDTTDGYFQNTLAQPSTPVQSSPQESGLRADQEYQQAGLEMGSKRAASSKWPLPR